MKISEEQFEEILKARTRAGLDFVDTGIFVNAAVWYLCCKSSQDIRKVIEEYRDASSEFSR